MIFNTHTDDLFVDKGDLLKKVSCPLNSRWIEPESSVFSLHKCDDRERPEFDIGLLIDREIRQLMKTGAKTCFKVDINQNNLPITYH
jgi:hypothetical protein